MALSNKEKWWNIFTEDRTFQEEDSCPAVPVESGQDWQKGLATLYCPCKSDPAAYECLLPLF